MLIRKPVSVRVWNASARFRGCLNEAGISTLVDLVCDALGFHIAAKTIVAYKPRIGTGKAFTFSTVLNESHLVISTYPEAHLVTVDLGSCKAVAFSAVVTACAKMGLSLVGEPRAWSW